MDCPEIKIEIKQEFDDREENSETFFNPDPLQQIDIKLEEQDFHPDSVSPSIQTRESVLKDDIQASANIQPSESTPNNTEDSSQESEIQNSSQLIILEPFKSQPLNTASHIANRPSFPPLIYPSPMYHTFELRTLNKQSTSTSFDSHPKERKTQIPRKCHVCSRFFATLRGKDFTAKT